MRVKAFSLIELIVVVFLLGTIFSLGLGLFSSKKKVFNNSDIKNFPQYIKKIALQNDAIFYIYGDKCKKNTLISANEIYSESSTFTLDKSYKIYTKDSEGDLKSFDYPPATLDKKMQHICLKINITKGKFTDKLLLDTENEHLLFMPLYQEVKSFDSLQKAKDAYFQDTILPKGTDDYHH